MDKEEYYNKIKRFIYKRFNELEVIEHNNGNLIYLHYKNEGHVEVIIQKEFGSVLNYYKFRQKICKMVDLKVVDFEILLNRWVEDTLKIKVVRNSEFDFKVVFSG
jgi:hypothetical protein